MQYFKDDATAFKLGEVGVRQLGLVIGSSLKSDMTEILVDYSALRKGVRYGHLAIVQKAHGGQFLAMPVFSS